MDVRAQKDVRLQRATLAVIVDVFNLGNAATVLGRQYDITTIGDTGYDKVLEIMNPRILRVGLRLNF